ncbi:MAG: signal peptidase I [Candidatus Taylorbacteria bacterium]|nr:signal peptidase I [Candidatus Taylorbacteria bacterium]
MEEQKSDNTSNSIKEVIKFTVIAVIIIVFIRAYIAQPFIVDGASMDPTFKTGEYLIVDELSYEIFNNPARYDVVVFKYPNQPSVYFIKRVIGLPGETVKINEGVVTVINKENPAGFVVDSSYVDKSHYISDSFESTLGNDQYFVMGDNRAQSLDSRAWGLLDKKYIVGKPFIRLLPPGSIKFFPGSITNTSN